MELKLTRIKKGELYCLGDWTQVNDDGTETHLWYSCEDTEREYPDKIAGLTAIWKGRYQIKMTWSNRFQRLMPQIMGVLMFSGIRIHKGNRPEDTEGCPVTGNEMGDGCVRDSQNCFDDKVYPFFQKHCAAGEVWVTVQ